MQVTQVTGRGRQSGKVASFPSLFRHYFTSIPRLNFLKKFNQNNFGKVVSKLEESEV